MLKNRSAEFYDRFASKYDQMTSDRRYDEHLALFGNILEKHKVKSVLDCSCGTGRHVIRLVQAGYEAMGSDISAEMISQARRNAKAFGVDAEFIQADFKKLRDVYDRKFDCVVCWGNSLNHELEEQGILSALRSMRSVLKDGGLIIVQIRNLPKWVRERRRFLPMHSHKEPNGDRKVFIYAIDFFKKKARFNVMSYLESNGKPTFGVDSVDYRIVPAHDLKRFVVRAGFRKAEIYEDLRLGEFDAQRSENIVVLGFV